MAVQPPIEAPAQPSPATERAPGPTEGKLLTIFEHLQELRYRLMVCAGALIITVSASFALAGYAIEWLKEPAEREYDNFQLAFFDPLEGWTTYFRVSLLLGIAMSMPVFIYQLLAFVGPGLTPAERRWLYPIVLGATAAFLGGCAFAYYIELPPALHFLLNPPSDIGEPVISSRKYFDFVTRTMLVTGLVFELPLVVMGLAKVGVVTSRRLFGWWRQAIIVAFVLAAIVTPSVDPITQSLVAGPIIILYFVGIALAKLVESNPLIPRST